MADIGFTVFITVGEPMKGDEAGGYGKEYIQHYNLPLRLLLEHDI